MPPLNLFTRLESELLLPSIVTVISSSLISYVLFPLLVLRTISSSSILLIVPLLLVVDSSPSDITIIVEATLPLHTATTESPVESFATEELFPSAPVTEVVALAVNFFVEPFTDTETEYPLPELVISVIFPAY